MKKAVVLLIIGVAASSVQASSWQLVTMTGTPERTVSKVFLSSGHSRVRMPNGSLVAHAWIAEKYLEKQTYQGVTFNQIVTFAQYDCTLGTTAESLKHLQLIDPQMIGFKSDSETVGTIGDNTFNHRVKILPNTQQELIRKIVCN